MDECTRIQAAQEQWLDGTADVHTRAEVHAHHDGCEACRAYVERVRALEAQQLVSSPRSRMARLTEWAKCHQSHRRAGVVLAAAVGVSALLALTGVDLGTGSASWELFAGVAWNCGLLGLGLWVARRANRRRLLHEL